jgi:hypothetical protein
MGWRSSALLSSRFFALCIRSRFALSLIFDVYHFATGDVGVIFESLNDAAQKRLVARDRGSEGVLNYSNLLVFLLK